MLAHGEPASIAGAAPCSRGPSVPSTRDAPPGAPGAGSVLREPRAPDRCPPLALASAGSLAPWAQHLMTVPNAKAAASEWGPPPDVRQGGTGRPPSAGASGGSTSVRRLHTQYTAPVIRKRRRVLESSSPSPDPLGGGPGAAACSDAARERPDPADPPRSSPPWRLPETNPAHAPGPRPRPGHPPVPIPPAVPWGAGSRCLSSGGGRKRPSHTPTRRRSRREPTRTAPAGPSCTGRAAAMRSAARGRPCRRCTSTAGETRLRGKPSATQRTPSCTRASWSRRSGRSWFRQVRNRSTIQQKEQAARADTQREMAAVEAAWQATADAPPSRKVFKGRARYYRTRKLLQQERVRVESRVVRECTKHQLLELLEGKYCTWPGRRVPTRAPGTASGCSTYGRADCRLGDRRSQSSTWVWPDCGPADDRGRGTRRTSGARGAQSGGSAEPDVAARCLPSSLQSPPRSPLGRAAH